MGYRIKRFIFELQFESKFMETISFRALGNNKLVHAQFKFVYAQIIEVLSNRAQHPVELEHCGSDSGGAGQTST